jgi:hypothetical protein
LPLAVAQVLALFVDLAGVVAVEYRVEHDLRVVAVGVGPGAEALGVREDSGELAGQRAPRGVLDFGPAEGEPLRGREVLGAAELRAQFVAVAALRAGGDSCKTERRRMSCGYTFFCSRATFAAKIISDIEFCSFISPQKKISFVLLSGAKNESLEH